MKTIPQKIQLVFSSIEYWIARQIGDLNLEHEAMQSRAILQTKLRVAREQVRNEHLFTNINHKP